MSEDQTTTEPKMLKLVDRLGDELVEGIAVLAIAGIAIGGEATTVSVGGIVAVAGGRRAVKGLSSVAG